MDKEGRKARLGVVAAALTVAVLTAGAAAGQVVTDVLTIGTMSVSSGTGQVKVPIYIQDNTGTRIGRDQPPGSRISGFSMQVVYGPNACIDTPASPGQRIDLTGGILASQFADIDSRPNVPNTSQSWIYSSAESNGLIPFTAAAAPGDRIGAMVFNLNGCPTGTINLVIATSGGTAARLNSDNSRDNESVGDGLSVVNGAINIGVSGSTPTITPTPTPSITPTGSVTPTGPTNTPTRTPTNSPLTPTNTPGGVTPPVIDFINPSLGTTRGGTFVTISGNRFQIGAKVFFGDKPATSVDFANPQVLFARTDAHAAATVDVIVTNPDGGTTRLVNGFRYAPLVETPRPRPTPRALDRPQS